MSRTEGVHLPRIPTSHTRVTSSRAMRHHAAATSSLRTAETHRRRSLSEPSYTAYVGTPRQDIPHPVFSDAAMYDDVFDKEGRLLSCRNTTKFTSPLQTVGYNSLNDPHCRKLFLNNKRLRSHLINLGLITDDLKVVATTKEQRQKIRAHELLERKEMLADKLQQREQERLKRLSQPSTGHHLPRLYQDSIARHDERRDQWAKVQEMKTQKIIRHQEQERVERARKLRQKKMELERAIDEARLQEQAQRNALRVQQQMAEIRAYEKAYGKNAHWHREADKINNRMVAMKLQWANKKSQQILSQSFPPPSLSSQTSGEEEEKLNRSPPRMKERERVKLSSSLVTTRVEPGRPKEGREDRVRGEGERAGERDRRVEEEHGDDEGEGEHENNLIEMNSTPKQKEEENELKSAEGLGGEEEEKEEVISEKAKKDEERTPLKARSSLHDGITKGSSSQSPPPPPPSLPDSVSDHPHQQNVLDGDLAKEELTRILIDALRSVDGESGSGYMTVDEFLQVLTSPDLGLKLEENEQAYIASQVVPENSRVLAYVEAACLVPDLLLWIYSQRAQLSVEYYGASMEEEWVQLHPVTGGVVYLNKLTGSLQSLRPDEYRPFLKDEVFEDSLVDFFDMADTDRDGIIDYEDFYNLLASSQVASRVYREQMEELLGLYQSQTVATEGLVDLASFPTVANPLLLMIYQNAYPDIEEWIELDSKKFGTFWLHKITGEIVLQQTGGVGGGGGGGGSGDGKSQRTRKKSRSKRKKKHSRRVALEEENDLMVTGRSDDQRGGSPSTNDPLPPTDQEVHATSPSHKDEVVAEDKVAVETEVEREEEEEVVVKPVSSRSRLIIPAVFETIPEEDETALDDSIATQAIVREERDGERGEDKEEGSRNKRKNSETLASKENQTKEEDAGKENQIGKTD